MQQCKKKKQTLLTTLWDIFVCQVHSENLEHLFNPFLFKNPEYYNGKHEANSHPMQFYCG